ncbi:MAG TPA: LysE family transporter, partial [Candidatus Deferrimicrobiaceae bacterium]
NPHPYLFWVTVGAPMILKGWAKDPAFALAFVLGLYVCLVSSQMVLAVVAARSRSLLDGKGYLLMMRVLGVLLALFAVLLLKDGMTLLELL